MLLPVTQVATKFFPLMYVYHTVFMSNFNEDQLDHKSFLFLKGEDILNSVIIIENILIQREENDVHSCGACTSVRANEGA